MYVMEHAPTLEVRANVATGSAAFPVKGNTQPSRMQLIGRQRESDV